MTRYTETTGDTGLLDEQAPFLDGRALAPDEESYYDLPRTSDETATVYEHCVRAIRASLKTGAHGLPLIGAGDWNDGMNRVGSKGAGESVWLAFFLNHVLTRFSDVAGKKGDAAFARECREHAESLALAIEEHAWDGKWYRRAYFDDGSVLGSASNEECRIDSLPQSWAAISKTGSPERRAAALNSACAMLVEEDMKLIRLFTPPFDSGSSQPGYIRGYVPGVRENGGQYTHAAVWLAMAMAEMNDAERAWHLFSLLNPVRHGDTDAAVARYRIEPYVAAGDVYTAAGHEGRGGWSWYTGSAGWMYNLLIEKLLGLRIAADRLYVRPLPHPDWKEYSLHYRYRSTFYHIRVLKVGPNPRNTVRITVNGNVQPEPWIHLADDGWERNAVVEVG